MITTYTRHDGTIASHEIPYRFGIPADEQDELAQIIAALLREHDGVLPVRHNPSKGHIGLLRAFKHRLKTYAKELLPELGFVIEYRMLDGSWTQVLAFYSEGCADRKMIDKQKAHEKAKRKARKRHAVLVAARNAEKKAAAGRGLKKGWKKSWGGKPV